MDRSPHIHVHPHGHSHAKECTCHHEHEHGHSHPHTHDDHENNFLSLPRRWILTVLIVCSLLLILRSFIISQMLVRVTSYSASSSYTDAVRICKKIIALDGDNKQAWTALGYAYMDLFQMDMAIHAFDKVLSLCPEDKGAASFELGEAYYSKGNFTKAIEYFERVRASGPRAGALLEADILKYRHGALGFRNLNSMQTLLGDLLNCYKRVGDKAKVSEVQQEYDLYKAKHNRILF